jgi:ribosomal-protein-alanine N-acetyltransferase
MSADTVETLRAADIPLVARLHARCFFDAWSADMMRQILSMPGAYGLVARSGGRGAVIGFALCRVAVDECELLSIGVDADHRARGVGARLLEAAMTRAVAERARRFFLEVAEDNGPAQKLYAAHGLIAVGRRPDYYENADGSRTHALTMRCDLPFPAQAQRSV